MNASSSETGWLPGPERDLPLLRAAVQRIVRELRPEEIWIFGSRVAGEPREGSDWDLLVVLPDGAPERSLEPIAAWEIVREVGLPIDLVPCTRSEFDEEKDEIDTLSRAAYTKGLCIFMSLEKRSGAYLDLCQQDLDAAEVLAKAANRYAAYHCQQAIEKLLKALMLKAGTEAGLENRIDVLLTRLGDQHPWSPVIRPFDKDTPFATTFRYPTPGGRIPVGPSSQSVLADVEALRTLLARARGELQPTVR